MKQEYKTLEDHLDKLERDQDLIEQQLNAFVNELEKAHRERVSAYEARTPGSVVTKCKDLNDRLARVDSEIGGMVQAFNQDTHAPDKIDSESTSVNVNIILNNYFHTLRNLEMEAVSVRRRLEDVCERSRLK